MSFLVQRVLLEALIIRGPCSHVVVGNSMTERALQTRLLVVLRVLVDGCRFRVVHYLANVFVISKDRSIFAPLWRGDKPAGGREHRTSDNKMRSTLVQKRPGLLLLKYIQHGNNLSLTRSQSASHRAPSSSLPLITRLLLNGTCLRQAGWTVNIEFGSFT